MNWQSLCSRAVYFPRLPLSTEAQVRSVCVSVCEIEMHHLFVELIQYTGLWLRVYSDWYRIVLPNWRRVVSPRLSSLFDGYLTIVPQCVWVFLAFERSQEKRTHPAQLTGFILYGVRAICKTTILWILTLHFLIFLISTSSFYSKVTQKNR